MNEYVAEAYAAFTVNGGADGFITVADNTSFYPGAFAWISSATQPSRRVQITSLSGATKIGVRFYGDSASGASFDASISYGRSDVSAFLLADAAAINQEGQVVRVVQPALANAADVATLAGATFITQTPSAVLGSEQALSLLATGILKSTTVTGVVSIASPVTDYVPPADLALKVPSLSFFGDASDGDVTIAADTTLTRDMYYNNLTVNTGKVLNPAGWRIFVKGTLTLSGTGKIASNGGAGNNASATGGVGAIEDARNLKVNGSLASSGVKPFIGTKGGAGGTVAGSPAPSWTRTFGVEFEIACGKAGGAGGAGSSGAGGSAGQLDDSGGGEPLNTLHSVVDFVALPLGGITAGAAQLVSYVGGTGGGGGGGSTVKRGGSGGGGGGVVLVFAYIVAGSGTIEAHGGNGGNGDAAGNTGGGGGGGGGFVGLVYHSGAPSTSVVGGTKGVKGGTGVDGVDGTAGTVISFQI